MSESSAEAVYARHLSGEATMFRWLSIPLWALAAVVFVITMSDLAVAGHSVPEWTLAVVIFLAGGCSEREHNARKELRELAEPGEPSGETLADEPRQSRPSTRS